MMFGVDRKRNGYSRSVQHFSVVTGGTGFVGLRLVEMLVERGRLLQNVFD